MSPIDRAVQFAESWLECRVDDRVAAMTRELVERLSAPDAQVSFWSVRPESGVADYAQVLAGPYQFAVRGLPRAHADSPHVVSELRVAVSRDEQLIGADMSLEDAVKAATA